MTSRLPFASKMCYVSGSCECWRQAVVRCYFLLACVLLASGCSTTHWKSLGKTADPNEGRPPEAIYQLAKEQIQKKRFDAAIRHLESLEAQYPFGVTTEQAQLDLIYVHEKLGDTDAALAAADRFIRLHPRHPNVDYAYYMRGYAKYNEDRTAFKRWFYPNTAARDDGPDVQAYAYFLEYVTRYPQSSYVADAKMRMNVLRETLAEHEMNVARFYLKRGAYLAANQRASYVVSNYAQTAVVPDALAMMAKTYQLLGFSALAEDANTVLQQNFSQS